MNTERRLYRSRNALIGGVCAGVAEYFNVDPLVARILTVALTLSTAGLFAVAYVALWIVLPLKPDEAGPVEVEPHSVHSDTYGAVDFEAARRRADDTARAAAEVAAAHQHLPYSAYAGTGHAPPEPPAAAAAAWTAETPPDAPSQPVYGSSENVPPVNIPPYPPNTPPWPVPSQPLSPNVPEAQSPGTGGIRAGVFIGSFLLFLGIAALLSESIDGVSWWQFWPLVFAIVGIVQMVVPGEPGHRMSQFVSGLMLFSLGGTLLPMSLGVVGWATLGFMLANLWPLLLIMVGFFIIGAAVRSPWWTLAAGVCFVCFCGAGLLWFAVPGFTDIIVLALPFDREFSFPFELSVTRVS